MAVVLKAHALWTEQTSAMCCFYDTVVISPWHNHSKFEVNTIFYILLTCITALLSVIYINTMFRKYSFIFISYIFITLYIFFLVKDDCTTCIFNRKCNLEFNLICVLPGIHGHIVFIGIRSRLKVKLALFILQPALVCV